MENEELKKYECLRCNHVWIPRKEQYPKVCPNCKSAWWDNPKNNEKEVLDNGDQ